MTRRIVTTLAGFALIIGGLAVIYLPAALILAGMVLVVEGLLSDGTTS